jgi:hypothetical protein
MSNDLAIAAVTATIRSLLEFQGGDLTITTKPPDKAERDNQNRRLNLYLYQTSVNAAWRNRDLPNRVKPGEIGHPPLPLDLHYLLTAYGDDSPDVLDQRLLGRAMRILHDHALLSPEDVLNATEGNGALEQSDLHEQIEAVRITPAPLSLDEISKLWTTFQTPYRASATFQASVVLIESQRPGRSAMPVLHRGAEDRGPEARLEMDPVLLRIEHRDALARQPNMPAAELESVITLVGEHMPGGEETKIEIRDPKQPATPENPDRGVIATLPIQDSDGARITAKLVPAAGAWLSGVLTAAVRFPDARQKEGTEPRHRVSNALPFGLAAKLTVDATTNELKAQFVTIGGRRFVRLECKPPFPTGSSVWLMLNSTRDSAPGAPAVSASPGASYQLPWETDAAGSSPATPMFNVHNVSPGVYRARLRVDGVDSLVVERDESGGYTMNSKLVLRIE